LANTDLTGANFTGAIITDANLKGATLIGADFSGSDLSGSDLKGADLAGASLVGADLTGISYNNETDFTGALYDANTRFDPFFDMTGLILVPEPSTAALLTFGLTLLAFRRVSWRPHRRLRALTPPQGI
jgi:uncharacterized protein YjbI with pentapeptide repeats